VDEQDAAAVERELSERFKMKALGDARFVLGMGVTYARAEGKVRLRQSQFINRMVDRFGQHDAFPVRNPSIVGQDLRPAKEAKIGTLDKPYRQLVGSLLYVSNGSRPDICASVSALSQYLDKAQDMHWREAIRVLRYIKGSKRVSLAFTRGVQKDLNVLSYCDTNWGGEPETRRSTSGVLVLMDGAPIIFKSKRQSLVALSTAEAEYMALALATQELAWLRQLLSEIHVQAAMPMVVNVDNQAAISIACNRGYSARIKHVDLRVHFIRNHVHAGHIRIKYVPLTKQLADFLTKPLPTPLFQKLVAASGVASHQVEREC
jgi:hypothetical protein